MDVGEVCEGADMFLDMSQMLGRVSLWGGLWGQPRPSRLSTHSIGESFAPIRRIEAW